MIRSTPSSRARLAASMPRMPQSTETISDTPSSVQPLDRGRLQAVAVLQPLGNEMDDVAAEHFERAAEDDGRGDAVDVVVAMDRDPLAPRDRLLEPLDRRHHAGQLERIVQMVERGLEEALGGFRIVEPAQAQQPRDRRVQIERRRELRHPAVVARQVMPDQRLHARRPRPRRPPCR